MLGDSHKPSVFIHTVSFTHYGATKTHLPVILLHIVMVRPGTHLVKNHESQSRNNESQLKK